MQSRWSLCGLALLAALLAACGDGDSGGTGGNNSAPKTYAILSAFPAELAAVLEHVDVDETRQVEGRTVRVGHLGKTQVIAAMTGIGLLNAAMTTNIILDNFAVDGVIVSGVAGSPNRIGDVVVPQAWAADDNVAYAADTGWLALARRAATHDATSLDHCTMVPTHQNQVVCLTFQPAILVGGIGHSSDTFGSTPFQCTPTGGDVFGCDVAQTHAGLHRGAGAPPLSTRGVADDELVSSDMETAAIGRAAAEHGVPYIAFRADSDGADDPLGLPGFPTQFFAYYPLAAHNAAAAATDFVQRLPR